MKTRRFGDAKLNLTDTDITRIDLSYEYCPDSFNCGDDEFNEILEISTKNAWSYLTTRFPNAIIEVDFLRGGNCGATQCSIDLSVEAETGDETFESSFGHDHSMRFVWDSVLYDLDNDESTSLFDYAVAELCQTLDEMDWVSM